MGSKVSVAFRGMFLLVSFKALRRPCSNCIALSMSSREMQTCVMMRRTDSSTPCHNTYTDFSVQHQWTQDVVEACKQSPDGCVQTIGGRRRHIPKINDRDGTWAGEAERKARNTVPQGSAADIAKTAMLRLHRRAREELPDKCNILLMASSDSSPHCTPFV